MSFNNLHREFGRIGVFIDGNNLFHAARSMGIEIDYAKLLAVFSRYGPLMRAFFYTGVDENASKQQGFLLWMKRNGYRVVQKDLKVFPDGSKRANLDVEIVVDMLNLSKTTDTIALVSGDEDFTYALQHLTQMGKQVILAGFRVNTSPYLMDASDYFLDLESIIGDIVKDSSSSGPTEFYIQQNQVKSSTLANRLAASQGNLSGVARTGTKGDEGILDNNS